MRVTLYPISMSCLVAGNRTTKIDGWGYSGPAFSRVSAFFFPPFLAASWQSSVSSSEMTWAAGCERVQRMPYHGVPPALHDRASTLHV